MAWRAIRAAWRDCATGLPATGTRPPFSIRLPSCATRNRLRTNVAAFPVRRRAARNRAVARTFGEDRKWFASLAASGAGTEGERSAQLLRRAAELQQAGDDGGAEECYREVLTLQPENSVAARRLAQSACLARRRAPGTWRVRCRHRELRGIARARIESGRRCTTTWETSTGARAGWRMRSRPIVSRPRRMRASLKQPKPGHGARANGGGRRSDGAMPHRPCAKAFFRRGQPEPRIPSRAGGWTRRVRWNATARRLTPGRTTPKRTSTTRSNCCCEETTKTGGRNNEWRTRLPGLEGAWPQAWDGSPHGGQGHPPLWGAGFWRCSPVRALRADGGRAGRQGYPQLPTQAESAARDRAGCFDGAGDWRAASSVRCQLFAPESAADFGTTVETIPARVPYVRADAERSQYWKAKLAGDAASVEGRAVLVDRVQEQNLASAIAQPRHAGAHWLACQGSPTTACKEARPQPRRRAHRGE